MGIAMRWGEALNAVNQPVRKAIPLGRPKEPSRKWRLFLFKLGSVAMVFLLCYVV